ncbi:MAG TPA: retroviral-like aspartic protease family protein [Tepidisphaeraceae bacterium]|jgi:clan AA aspartic protease (TIGR02281 family)
MMLLACACLVRADDDTSPEGILKSKGLIKVGSYYLLDADVKLSDGLRTIRKAQKDIDDYGKKRHAIEADIDKAKTSAIQWGRQMTAIQDQMTRTTDTRQYNQLVGQSNSLANNIKEAEQYIEQRQADLRKLPAPGDDQITATIDLADKMEAAARRYEALAADSDVKSALSQINEKSTIKFRLGPSVQFATELPKMRKQRDALHSAVIKFEIKGGVPHVQATLNGSVSTSMIVDSGASVVSLSSEVASQLGMKPGADDPVATLVLADGKQVQAHLMKIASVRVGQFTVQNVECAILPPTVRNADCLLGGTFLRNFIYRMDLTAGELHMTPLTATADASSAESSGTKKSTSRPTSAPTGRATSRPAS